MNDTQHRIIVRSLRSELEENLQAVEGSVPDLFVESMRAFITAYEYRDSTLMQAHFQTAIDTIRDKAAIEATDMVVRSRRAYQSAEKFLHLLDDAVVVPSEEFDQLGRGLSNLIARITRTLSDLSGVGHLMEKAHTQATWVHDVDQELGKWVALKRSLLDDWPYTDLPVPPIDTEMAKRSQEALARGEGLLLSEVIRQHGGV